MRHILTYLELAATKLGIDYQVNLQDWITITQRQRQIQMQTQGHFESILKEGPTILSQYYSPISIWQQLNLVGQQYFKLYGGPLKNVKTIKVKKR